MKNIELIGIDYHRDSFSPLSESIDRLRSCYYFCDQTQLYAVQEIDHKALWYFRAALSAYQSVLDNISGDIKRYLGEKLWSKSDQCRLMMNHPLVKILSKARNFAVHSSRLKGQAKTYYVTRFDENGENIETVRSLFFDELDKKKNFKDASNVSIDEITWFNEQAKTWPVHLLIRHRLYEASKHVQHFNAVHKIV